MRIAYSKKFEIERNEVRCIICNREIKYYRYMLYYQKSNTMYCSACAKREMYMLIQANRYLRESKERCSVASLINRYNDESEKHSKFFSKNFTHNEISRLKIQITVVDIKKWVKEKIFILKNVSF